MNDVFLSKEIDSLRKDADPSAAKKPRFLKDLEHAQEVFEDRYDVLKNRRRKNPTAIGLSDHKGLYERIASEFGIPEILDPARNEKLWHWECGEGRRIIAYIGENGGKRKVVLLKYFLGHKNYADYCGYRR